MTTVLAAEPVAGSWFLDCWRSVENHSEFEFDCWLAADTHCWLVGSHCWLADIRLSMCSGFVRLLGW